jgi:uncharacterized YccA/Bax inhibitor family protein
MVIKEATMATYRSGNPALGESTFKGLESVDHDNVMTLQGTVNKTTLLLLILFLPAIYVWNLFNSTQDFATVAPLFYIGIFGGLITGIVLAFKKNLAPFLSIAYAGFEGLAMGGLSAFMNALYPGIVVQALLLTFGICFALLLIYTLRIIKPTENFKLMVGAATGGIALFYLVSFVLSFFNIRVPLIHDNSIWGILFSLFVVCIAALNLVVDFDFIEQGAARKAPKYMEWYGAFGLMVTLIWLYVEILRLLSKLRSRN